MFTYLINLREHLSSTTVFLVGSVLLIFFCFMCCPIRCLCSDFRVVMSVTISAWKRCSVRLHLQLFVGGRISYLRYFCLFAQWCLTHIVLCFCFIFLRLMNPMLPVSLDCPFLIAPSVFSSVYFRVLIQVLQVNMNLRLRNRLLKLQLFQFLQEQTYGIFGQVDNLTSNELFKIR
jgi:hypothetical protein